MLSKLSRVRLTVLPEISANSYITHIDLRIDWFFSTKIMLSRKSKANKYVRFVFPTLCSTMSLMIMCACTPTYHYAYNSKCIWNLYELWNESLHHIMPCHALFINSLLGLARRHTYLCCLNLRKLYVSGKVWEVPFRLQGNMCFCKTSYNDDYVCYMSPPPIWFIWSSCIRSYK